MKLRVISLLLVIAMALVLVPTPVSSVAITPSEIEQQIRSAYKSALRGSGMSSFHGYCGALVNWQMYCLGINKTVYSGNGNNQFDMYQAMEKTTGGYSIETYPASKYTLLEAMNAITHNGTQDVYNLIVGFQKTNTVAGKIYGHALLVHAVIDGTVYFVEGFDANVGGKFFAEGEPISCSIEQFCAYYDRWTVFDGIAYFGLRTYADLCTVYSCTIKAMATTEGMIYEEPGDPGVHDPEAVAKLVSGQWYTVTGLLQTPNGKYWYRIEQNDRTYYVEAEKLTMGSVDTSDIKINGLRTPGCLRKNYSFTMGGTITSQHSKIRNIQVNVYSMDDLAKPLFGTTMEVNGKTAALNKSQLNNGLQFRNLPVGNYELQLSMELEINIFDGEKVKTHIEKIHLWNGRFLVVGDWNTYPVVNFNGNGGTPRLDQVVVAKNQTIGGLPMADRSGYAFAGWTLDKAGTQPVTPDTVITKNTTLYAQWKDGHSGDGGWQETEDGWHYCAGTFPVAGWIQFGDLRFYQYKDGTLAKGWLWMDGNLWYFNDAGALVPRLETTFGKNFAIGSDDKGTFGWVDGDNRPAGPIQITPEAAQQQLAQVNKMPAACSAMQKLSSGIYWLAVKLTAGELPQQIQDLLNK